MRGPSTRRRIASLLALLLLLQGFTATFARLPLAAPGGTEICTGAGLRTLPAPGDEPVAPDRSHCLFCLLPVSLGAPAPLEPPLPQPRLLRRDPAPEPRCSALRAPRSSWPRAPPRA